MRLLVPLELLTSLIYGYLGLALPWNSAPSVIQALHFVVVCLAGIAIAVGAWRRARWVPKGAILLVAWVGIPTLASLAAVVHVTTSIMQTAVVLSFELVLAAAFCQLLALWVAMRHLEFRSAAV